MTAKDERTRGVEILTEILLAGHILRVRNLRTFHDGYSYYFEVTAYDKVADFCLSAEVIEDMQGTPEYREQANSFARAVEIRLRNPNPQAFMTKTGVPVEVESFWPHEAWPGRLASYVRTNVRDLRDSKLAKCFVVVTHQELIFELKENPFIEFAGIVNSVRNTIDAGNLMFYPENDHPDTLQQVDLRLEKRQHTDLKTLEMFLERKVFWLGFKADNAGSLVWIADPWDADYMGVSSPELAREAEILEAHSVVRLDESRHFASAGRDLLLRARELESGITTLRESSDKDDKPANEWDVFISHASEDKESFVHPLAEELTRRGVRVWYDNFTLKLGDSLREKIDYGLRYSRFGVVVLSPLFFSKDWPKKELDGLVALEVEGRKVILPVWHNVSQGDSRKILADSCGSLSSLNLDWIGQCGGRDSTGYRVIRLDRAEPVPRLSRRESQELWRRAQTARHTLDTRCTQNRRA
jgi:hypothetical protein